VSGSDGDVLFLSPETIHHGGSGWNGLEGPAIEINHMTSGASGRYEVAEIMARVFPAYRAFARKVLEGMGLPFPAGPYPNDTLTNHGQMIVEYSTPAQAEGLGNFHSWLEKNGFPIRGAAIIVDDAPNGPDAVLLSVRFPPALTGLVPAIVGQFERDTAGGRH
jgi:hypothetical protein